MQRSTPSSERAIRRIQPPLFTRVVEQLALTEPGSRFRTKILRDMGYEAEGGRAYGYMDELEELGAVTACEPLLDQYYEEGGPPEYDFTPEFAVKLAQHWRERITRLSGALISLNQRFPFERDFPEPRTFE